MSRALIRRLAADIRDAVRGLRVGRRTTTVAFVLLSLAMATATVTYSVVDAVAIRPLPFASPERLVSIGGPARGGTTAWPVAPQDYFAWVDRAHSFSGLGASKFTPSLQLDDSGPGESLRTTAVTANLFHVLGVRPELGRLFRDGDDGQGAAPTVVMSYDLWTRRFASSPNVIGQQLRFADGPREIVGVLPAGVAFPISAAAASDVYIPYIASDAERSAATSARTLTLRVVGRLRPDVSVEEARADATRIAPGVVTTLTDEVIGPQRQWLLLVLAAVWFVLLVACVNVASLLLARATTRAREFATREALGASRWRLRRVLLLEGLLLAVGAAAVGVVLSLWAVEVVKASLPAGLARVSTIAVNGRVLLAAAAVALASALVSGSAPAWLASRSDLISLMKSNGGPIIGSRRTNRALSVFLGLDMAIVSVLLVATVLVVTSFVLITTADLGFERQNVMAISYQRDLSEVPAPARAASAATLRNQLLERVTAMPGVVDAAVSANGSPPLGGGHVNYSLTIPGFGEADGDNMLETRMVTPSYFHVMGMRLERGRLFTDSDHAGAPLVMLINDVAARRFFQGRDPVGQVVTFRGPTTIVGVMRAVNFDGPEVEVRPEMYVPVDQEPARYQASRASGSLLVRTSRDPRQLAPAVLDAVRPSVGGELSQPRFLDESFRGLTAGRRFNAGVMAVFGSMAFVIGAIGIYGTMAFAVAQQSRAIGLRIALGASSGRVTRQILSAALRCVGAGALAGLACAWAASSLFSAFVFGIRPGEPVLYAAIGLFLMLVGGLAALAPAVSAARIDPITALRQD